MIYHIGGRLAVAGLSDVGLVRTLNEDNFFIDEELGLLLVADGMGGHEAGEVASEQVIGAILESLATTDFTFPEDPGPSSDSTLDIAISEEDLEESSMVLGDQGGDERTLDDIPNPILAAVTKAVRHANAEVHAMNVERGFPEGMGMGSTVVGLWLPEFSEQGVVFHVGDSRLYVCREGRLNQVTLDHTLYQQWASFGGGGPPPAKNILIQAMGPSRQVSPDVVFQDLLPGDVVLLCSDGLYGMVEDPDLLELVADVTTDTLEETCRVLVEVAKKNGGKDNVTVILGFVL